ncbi:shikimate kinase [Terriglobus sp. TAA 43]|uniref:shikimate kinase n=1 Tax=Terriglobus sp. TAA 43 TaxID=278961 RepID=UPI0006892C1B|nr:shikimate kinase [Terriglobus sp. TAA 43]
MTTLVAESAVIPPPATLLTERVVLTGFMGAGKSTVGRLLAADLGWDFLDVDAVIERHAGNTIEEIFATHGEAEFRRRESAAIARSLGARNTVIALGGGAPEEVTNRLLLEQTPNTTVVFLDAPFAVLFDRCVLQEGAAVRPNLQDPDAAAKRFQRRIPHYIRCSSHRIVTENLSIEQTVAAIRAQLL